MAMKMIFFFYDKYALDDNKVEERYRTNCHKRFIIEKSAICK